MTKRRVTFTPTERDCQIIEAIARYRALTTGQVNRLFFASDKTSSRCRLRLEHLGEHEYITSIDRHASTGERLDRLHMLAPQGAKLLHARLGEKPDWSKRDNDISPFFISHLVATNDVRIAITLSCRRNRWQLVRSLDSKTLKVMYPPQVADGYAQIAMPTPAGTTRTYHLFIEADRGTETLTRFGAKVAGYHEMSGAFTQVFGGMSFRVITVTTSPQRLINLKTTTETSGGKARFWFTTFEHIRGDILKDFVWEVAGQEGRAQLVDL